MRLKVKIVLICCISILFSLSIAGVAVYSVTKSNALAAAEGESSMLAFAEFTKLEDRIDNLEMGNIFVDVSILNYIFKQQEDEMLLGFLQGEDSGDIFNETIFEKEDLEKLSYSAHSETGMQIAKMKWEDRHFLVYKKERQLYSVYKLEDITYVWERTHLQGVELVILITVITILVSFFVFIVLGKVLRPLQRLNAGVSQIAAGHYDNRIMVERKDEIGELSEGFNQMADAVQVQIEKLKEAEWKRTLFMGNLTHELKTPMTAISGYAKTLLTVKLSEEDKEEALSYIYDESCRLERLSKKMMNLLMLEEDNQIEPAEVSAETLFRNAAEACGRSLEEDGIILECRDDGQVFSVDADLFTEVLINLIDNARKASKNGDKIILSAADHAIEVRDFGKGIPEDEKEKILEPFYMIDKSRSRKSGGAGLGLAITALILKQHNCTISIESEVGEGTRMILQFV